MHTSVAVFCIEIAPCVVAWLTALVTPAATSAVFDFWYGFCLMQKCRVQICENKSTLRHENLLGLLKQQPLAPLLPPAIVFFHRYGTEQNRQKK